MSVEVNAVSKMLRDKDFCNLEFVIYLKQRFGHSEEKIVLGLSTLLDSRLTATDNINILVEARRCARLLNWL
jgi:hypothetical protein